MDYELYHYGFFAILINRVASPFYHTKRGLRQGCPLSPLLFLLVVEGLSRFIKKSKADGDFKGIQISPGHAITHLLFVDDILIFCDGSRRGLQSLCQGMDLFHRATGMVINDEKLIVNWANLFESAIRALGTFFGFQNQDLDMGVKYLDFFLKPNDYRCKDWYWLLSKIEKKLSCWSHRWLSRVGRLVMVKAVLEAMSIYWMVLTWIPRGILEKIRKICFSFLWIDLKDKKMMPWVRRECIALPKSLRGLGSKKHFFIL